MSFETLGLNEALLRAVTDSGYTTPTPIQQKAIPAILTGQDVMAAAQTGTGKTAGFTLPLLQRLGATAPTGRKPVRALVLTPTRELAAQVQESIETYGKYQPLRAVVVFGGVKINPQMQALRNGCDILVATPGRLLDLYQQNAVRFDQLEILVLDEADRMLDMGFIRDIRKILAFLPKKRQNLMFSATFSDEIRTLARTICHQPVEIDVAPRNSTVDLITQSLYMTGKEQKLPLLGKLLQDTSEQVLVFSRTKHGANNLVKKLAPYGINAAAIHGNKSQAQRTKALASFKSNEIQVLIATDIAARGIDIDQLAMVINYELPQVPEDYVHRIGRTGRAGATGMAISLVSDEEGSQLRAIERLIKRRIERVGFDPASLPERVAQPEAETERPQAAPARSANRGGRGPRKPTQTPAARRPRSGGEPRVQAGGNRNGNVNGNTLGSSTATGQESDRPRRARGSRGRRGGQGTAVPAGQQGQSAARRQSSSSGNSASAQSRQPSDDRQSGFWQKLRDSLPGLGN